MKKRASKVVRDRAPPSPPVKDPEGPKPFRPRSVVMYVTDERVLALFDLLKDKWYNEGKIPEPKKNLAFMHMVRNFGEIAQRPPANNGSLSLDEVRRRKFAFLKRLFQVATASGNTDYDALNYAIDYLYEALGRDERLMQRFIEVKGRLRHG